MHKSRAGTKQLQECFERLTADFEERKKKLDMARSRKSAEHEKELKSFFKPKILTPRKRENFFQSRS